MRTSPVSFCNSSLSTAYYTIYKTFQCTVWNRRPNNWITLNKRSNIRYVNHEARDCRRHEKQMDESYKNAKIVQTDMYMYILLSKSTVAIMLQCCVCRLSVVCTECIVANGASYSKSYYWQPTGSRIWEIDWFQNEWPWPLFGDYLRSCQPLRHIHRWISRKPLEIEAWFQRIANRKWPTGIKWSRDRWRRVTPKGQTRDPNTLRAQYLENNWRCYLVATIANYYIVWCEAVYGRLS